MAQSALKNVPLSPAALDLGLGDALQSQVQAQVLENKKRQKQQGQDNGAGNDLINSLMQVSPATASLYGKAPGFGL